MDRVISLLAALVGLIALGGAILVHVNADTQRAEMAAEIAQIKASVGISPAPVQVAEAAQPSIHIPSAEHLTPSSSSAPPAAAETPMTSPAPPPSSAAASEPSPAAAASSASAPSSAPPADVAAQLSAMQSRIAELEASNKDQASQLASAQAQLVAKTPSSAPPGTASSSSDEPVATADLADGGPAIHADPTVPAKVLAADGPTKDCIPLGTRFMGKAGDSFPLCKTRMVLKVGLVTDGVATISGAGDVTAGATVAYGNGCLLAVFSADTTGYAEMRVNCQ